MKKVPFLRGLGFRGQRRAPPRSEAQGDGQSGELNRNSRDGNSVTLPLPRRARRPLPAARREIRGYSPRRRLKPATHGTASRQINFIRRLRTVGLPSGAAGDRRELRGGGCRRQQCVRGRPVWATAKPAGQSVFFAGKHFHRAGHDLCRRARRHRDGDGRRAAFHRCRRRICTRRWAPCCALTTRRTRAIN